MSLKRLQGLPSVAEGHSCVGIQKSTASIKSCVSLSRRMIENNPYETTTCLTLSEITRSSSKQLQIFSGKKSAEPVVESVAGVSSSQSQRQPQQSGSTIFALSATGSTVSTTTVGIPVHCQLPDISQLLLRLNSDLNIFELPSEPKRITRLSNVDKPYTVVGFRTPVNTSNVVRTKNFKNQPRNSRY